MYVSFQGIEIVEDRFAGAVQLHSAFYKTVSAEQEFRALMHPEVVGRKVHLLKVQYIIEKSSCEGTFCYMCVHKG